MGCGWMRSQGPRRGGGTQEESQKEGEGVEGGVGVGKMLREARTRWEERRGGPIPVAGGLDLAGLLSCGREFHLELRCCMFRGRHPWGPIQWPHHAHIPETTEGRRRASARVFSGPPPGVAQHFVHRVPPMPHHSQRTQRLLKTFPVRSNTTSWPESARIRPPHSLIHQWPLSHEGHSTTSPCPVGRSNLLLFMAIRRCASMPRLPPAQCCEDVPPVPRYVPVRSDLAALSLVKGEPALFLPLLLLLCCVVLCWTYESRLHLATVRVG